jgi:copper(I)-binding protein
MPNSLRTIALAAVMTLTGATLSFAHEIKVGDLLLTELWSRATPSGAKVGAAYVTIENKGTVPDRLISLSTSLGKAAVHEMSMNNGVMTMRPVEGGLTIAPGQKVTLSPGGFHVMVTDLTGPFKEGELLHVTLKFEKAGEVDATFHIRSVGAKESVEQSRKDGGKDGGKGDDKGGEMGKMPADHDHSGMKM